MWLNACFVFVAGIRRCDRCRASGAHIYTREFIECLNGEAYVSPSIDEECEMDISLALALIIGAAQASNREAGIFMLEIAMGFARGCDRMQYNCGQSQKVRLSFINLCIVYCFGSIWTILSRQRKRKIVAKSSKD